MDRKTVITVVLGLVIASLLGAGPSVVLAHGGGMGRGYGMGPMGMMGGAGMMGFAQMHHRHHMPMMGGMGMMGMGPGMMGGPGMMHGMGMGPLWMLDLNDDQRAKIHKLQDELRKGHWDTMGKIMDESSKLRELFAADKPDPKKIGAVYSNIFDLRRQMIETSIETHNRVDALLTKEQRDQLKQMGRGRGAGRGMMGPGMGQGDMMGG